MEFVVVHFLVISLAIPICLVSKVVACYSFFFSFSMYHNGFYTRAFKVQ